MSYFLGPGCGGYCRRSLESTKPRTRKDIGHHLRQHSYRPSIKPMILKRRKPLIRKGLRNRATRIRTWNQQIMSLLL